MKAYNKFMPVQSCYFHELSLEVCPLMILSGLLYAELFGDHLDQLFVRSVVHRRGRKLHLYDMTIHDPGNALLRRTGLHLYFKGNAVLCSFVRKIIIRINGCPAAIS